MPIKISLSSWRDKDYLITLSILLVDFSKLGEELDSVLAAGADIVYFDVIGNYCVLNLVIRLIACKALRNFGIICI